MALSRSSGWLLGSAVAAGTVVAVVVGTSASSEDRFVAADPATGASSEQDSGLGTASPTPEESAGVREVQVPIPESTDSATPALSPADVGLFTEQRMTMARVPTSFMWLVPVREDFTTFPVPNEADPSLSCGVSGQMDCYARFPDDDPSPCTPEQNTWLAERGIPQEKWAFTMEGAYFAPILYLENAHKGQGMMAVSSVFSNLAFEPMNTEFVVVTCEAHPAPGMGGAAGVVGLRQVVVPAREGQVAYGEGGLDESPTTAVHPPGSPLLVNLESGEGVNLGPSIPTEGAGTISGGLSLEVTVAGKIQPVALDILPGGGPVVVAPSDTARMNLRAGALCPEGAPTPEAEQCTLEEFMEANSVG